MLSDPPLPVEGRLPDPDHRPWPWWPPASARKEIASGAGNIDSTQLDVRHGVVLYLDDISVSFDGFKALNQLSLAIDAGELRCVIGPNGAGKTTMMDVITGKTRPDAGKVFFGTTIDLTKLTEPQIAHAGIGRKFQKPTIFENHTAFENLELSMKADKRVRSMVWPKKARPVSGRVLPVITSIIVVLPAPFGPITQRSSPASIASDNLFSALKPSKLTEMSSR